MKKILILNTIGMGYEGISSVIINYVTHMNCKDIQCDIIAYNQTPEELKLKLEKYCNVFIIPKKKQDFKGYIKGLSTLLKNNNYDAIHIHGNSGMMIIETLIAKKNKVHKIIVHCHNTTCDHKVLNIILKVPMKKIATNLLACSEESGKWLYGKSPYTVLNNAIDCKKFEFNSSIRNKIRKEFNIENKLVLGHIGSFIEQKNHEFLIDFFYEYQKEDCNSVLLLISDGPKFEQIKNKVKELNIEDKVIFAGRRGDIDLLYQAMDVYVMPSKWEGLPLVMLEAQACALPVIASENITKDAKCNDNVVFLPIDKGTQCWVNELKRIKNNPENREDDVFDNMKLHGFDIITEADKLKKIYID